MNKKQFGADISILTPAKGVTFYKRTGQSNFEISILTPAKGVTSGHSKFAVQGRISILTPAKGVTEIRMLLHGCVTYFNSHPREGGDIVHFHTLQRQLISILTPAKGVTFADATTMTKDAEFQFSPPRRG